MLTTKTETVKFHCRFSFQAFCLELVFFQLYFYILLSSALDIALSFALLGGLCRYHYAGALLKPKCLGNMTYAVTGHWQDDEGAAEIEEMNSTWSHWFLTVSLSDGRVKMLWRDSCRESVYRYLIVREKQRHSTSALKK